jgi:hypothetical protein
MFNPRNESREVINKFEIIGAFVIKLFYENAYQYAQNIFAKNGAKSITDAYLAVIPTYPKMFNDQKEVRTMLHHLYLYARNETNQLYLLESDWLTEYSKIFVPDNIFQSFRENQKIQVLTTILDHSIKKFATFISSANIIKMMIDNRHDTTFPGTMQNKMLEILAEEKSVMLTMFIRKQMGASVNNSDYNTLTLMREEIKKLSGNISSKEDYIKKQSEMLNKLHNHNSELESLMNEKNKQIYNLTSQVNMWRKRCAQMKAHIELQTEKQRMAERKLLEEPKLKTEAPELIVSNTAVENDTKDLFSDMFNDISIRRTNRDEL